MRKLKVLASLGSLLLINLAMIGSVYAGHHGGGSGSNDGAYGVPEPSTMLLLGAGIAGAVVYRKVQKRRKKDE